MLFRAKMPRCSHYIYCLQDESAHFGLKGLTDFCLRVLGHFEPTTKHNVHEDF